MAFQFRLQDPGEGIHEAEIVEVSVSKGDRVKEGDDVLVAETDKAAVDIPSPVSGEIVAINVSEGDIVEVGQVLMEIEESGAEQTLSDGEQKQQQAKQEEEDSAPEAEESREEPAEETQEEAKDEPAGGEKRGKAGDKARDKEAEAEKKEGAPEKKDRGNGGVLATPAVRGLARELGVDLEAISGSGEDGRVLEEDVRGAAEDGGTAEEASSADDQVERVKLRSLRRTTAKRMAAAWREIPHVTHADAVDITGIEKLRREHAAAVENRGGKLTLTPFLLKALAGALREHPRFNARFDAEQSEIEVFRRVNFGVALDTERGLLVPVLRDVGRKSVYDLAVELVELSQRLRRERPDPETLRGGTFTLTNVGGIGGTGLSPIINPPQVAIFGAARAELRQVMRGDIEDATAETRLMLPVCVTFDHRVNDGADSARFMNSVKQLLSSPQDFALRS